jgi:hypothetical protein
VSRRRRHAQADQLVLIDQALDRLVAAATGRSDRTAGRCGPDESSPTCSMIVRYEHHEMETA